MDIQEAAAAKNGTGFSLLNRRPSAVGLMVISVILCMVPLLVTPVLPLIDFYAHIARYFALGNVATDPWLAENYRPTWRLLPNLGLDVLGTGIMRVFPPLTGAKIIAALVILAPFAGALSLARVLHGRVSLINVALAGMLTFSFILAWGFSNFIIGLGIGMWALGLWISATFRPRLQLAVAVLLGVVIMLIHGLVFGLWGLLLFSVEVMLIRQAMPLPTMTIVWRVMRLGIIAALPLILFFQTKTASAEGGITAAFTNFGSYVENGKMWARLLEELWQRTDSFLRVAESAYPFLDRLFGFVLWAGLVAGFVSGKLTLDRRLWVAVTLCVAMVFVMPPNLFGVGHLDERMPLVLLALLAAGTRVPQSQGSSSNWLPTFMYVLFVIHIGMVCAAWAKDGRSYTQFLTAIKSLEPGGLATTAFFGDRPERDNGRECKPLLFMLLLENGSAVSTFANPTQQPIEIIGPLARAQDASRVIAGRDASAGRMASLDKGYEAGFSTIVTCDDPQLVPETGNANLVARNDVWSLYQE